MAKRKKESLAHIEASLHPLAVSLDSLHEDEANVRKHPSRNLDSIKASLTAFGQQKPVVVDGRGRIIAGNGMYQAAKLLGWKTIAYLPGSLLIGVSKLARVVNAFAKRLQVQERLTEQVARTIMDFGRARGVAVIMRGRHACMGCRGVVQPDAVLVTSSMLGVFRDDRAARFEALSLMGSDSNGNDAIWQS